MSSIIAGSCVNVLQMINTSMMNRVKNLKIEWDKFYFDYYYYYYCANGHMHLFYYYATSEMSAQDHKTKRKNVPNNRMIVLAVTLHNQKMNKIKENFVIIYSHEKLWVKNNWINSIFVQTTINCDDNRNETYANHSNKQWIWFEGMELCVGL